MPSSAPNGVPSAPNGVSHSKKPLWRPTEVRNAPPRTSFAFDRMEDALAAFSAGEFLVVMDDESRENEGDLIISASQCTTEKMAWMIKHTRCAPSSKLLLPIDRLNQRVHMHCAPWRPSTTIGPSDDGPAKSGTPSHSLHNYSRLQAR
jgi:3,4-dihydroxy 2-butanone 4-phosphate synthase